MDVTDVVPLIALLLAYFGVIIIAYGGGVAAYQTLYRGVKRSAQPTYTRIRGEFAQKIIFGLDFLIASDILNTISAPSLEEVARLGGVVVIRTILTFVMSKETDELRREEAGAVKPP